ncbi:VC0807 family protein [Lentibacillus sediminis]|uniref:VC0807 family protein n=1 Tax=Lentibacillus sediminis TaxID=1940529 RepID=UPI001864E89A|nr:VC0807 family protein [Lentibacillus sediminis]
MNKKLMLLDLICYAAIPFLIWNYAREPLGDYLAILLSTVPGFIYTIYRFIVEKQFNIAGIFIIGSLLITTMVNLLSSSAESMLWNQVYLGYGFAGIHLLSILILKPLALYFAVDWAYLLGHAREDSKALFSTKGLFSGFQLLTGLFVFRGVFQNSLKAWLLQVYGADGYGQMIIYMNISGWIFSALIFAGFVWISVKINKEVMSWEAASSLPEDGAEKQA